MKQYVTPADPAVQALVDDILHRELKVFSVPVIVKTSLFCSAACFELMRLRLTRFMWRVALERRRLGATHT